jgi:uncharacterized protein with ParB-like and HNH nuclease domain
MKLLQIDSTLPLIKFISENLFEIPEYQRAYAWKPENIDVLFDDIIETQKRQKQHFLGIVVSLKNEECDYKLSVIDGQQRITTTFLFLLSIRHYLRERNLTDNNDRNIKNINGIIDSVLDQQHTWTNEDFKYRMKTNHLNRELFEFIYSAGQKNDVDEYYRSLGNNISEPNKNLYKSYINIHKYIHEKIHSPLLEKEKDDSVFVIKLLDYISQYLKNFKVLEISVRDLSFAYEFFQSINNKGVNLSAFDIIKAKMFENCSGDVLYTDELNNNFNAIQANLGKIDPNSFLRHYWMSKYENITINKLLDKILVEVKSPQDSLNLFKDLNIYSLTYADVYNAETRTEKINSALSDVLCLARNFVMPVLLSSCHNINADNEKLIRIIKYVENYVFRFRTICHLENKKMEGTLCNIALEISKKKNDIELEFVLNKLKKDDPSDESFTALFKDHSSTNRIAMYILNKIEIFKSGKHPDKYKHSVEHIMPQNIEKWEKVVASFNIDHKELLNKIGNLTLITKSLNCSLKNDPFLNKLNHYKEYSSFKISDYIKKQTSWGEKEILQRHNHFAEISSKIWNLND